MNANSSGSAASIALLALAALLWSSGGLLIKSVEWNAFAIAGVRSLVSAVVILVFLGKRRPHFDRASVLATLAYAGTVICFVAATRNTTAANAILIQYTAPFWVALLGPLLLKERNHPRDGWAILGIAVGLVLFFRDDLAPGHLLGNLLALAAGFFFGSFVLASRGGRERPPLTPILFGNLLAGLACAPWYFRGDPPDATGFGLLVVLGVFQLGLGYVCFARAIGGVSAITGVLVLSLEPILNPLWVFLILGERPGPWALAGGTLVLGAVILRSVAAARAGVRLRRGG